MIIDIHTHCFPDKIAAYAVPKLESSAREGIKAVLNDTVSSLLKSMKEAGIGLSVVQHI